MRFFKTIFTAALLLGFTVDSRAQSSKPISLTFLIDVSVTQEPTISRTKKTSREFIKAILNSADNKAAVVTFAGQSSIKQPLTGDLKQIDAALKNIRFEPPPGYVGGGVVVGTAPPTKKGLALGLTAVWDAVWFTCEQIFAHPANERRQAIILVTDGQDTNSRKKIEDAIERAVDLDVAVYALGVGEREAVRRYEDRLRKLSDNTGGQAFFPRSEGEMRNVLGQIEQRLRG